MAMTHEAEISCSLALAGDELVETAGTYFGRKTPYRRSARSLSERELPAGPAVRRRMTSFRRSEPTEVGEP